GLHIWLPDAMEGPTPVSALIHSATMVTAGVFMVVRCSFLFELSPLVLNFMTIIGSVTSLFAASSALGQTDIKRVIAYSTSSQLGYMFVACGVSAYNAALFHLVTHAIFKSMIFLSAGSVIYACHEQDLEKLGGLWKKMPVTYASFWIGSLAIIGIFPFAGYYSKDMILDFVAARPREWIYYIAVITVFLTACYSMKLIMMIFHGQSKVGKVIFAKVCDARSLMTAPLLILAVLSISSGVFGYYYLRIYAIDGYLGKAIANFYDESTISFYADHTTLLVGSLGVVCAIFVLRNFIVTGNSNWAGRAIAKGYYFDEIYRLTIVRATFLLSKGLKFCDYNVIDRFGPKAFVDGIFFLGKVLKFFDYNVIDRLGPRAFTAITNSMTKIISRMQSGYLFDYALFMMLGLIIAVSMVLFIYIEKIL
nr:NADH-quinone oxidoreductase subunit L [Rickettsiaceae bacterium]